MSVFCENLSSIGHQKRCQFSESDLIREICYLAGWRKLKSALDVSNMAQKYLSYRIKRYKVGHVPRGGGRRSKGSFDSLDRYRQHLTPKRYNPNTEMFIHTTDVKWRHYKGCTNERSAISKIYFNFFKLYVQRS